LIELLVVMAVISILLVLVVPAFKSRKSADDFTRAGYTITAGMEQARTLSISKNTYVWLGFYEEDITATTPTTSTAPYVGKGRLVMATVYSKDGTGIYDIGLSKYSSGSWPLNQPGVGSQKGREPSSTDMIAQFGKIIKIDNVHVTDIGSPTPAPSPSPDSLEARSAMPYSSPSIALSSSNRLNSDSADATRFQFTVQGYTFWKTIRFSPRGEARINTNYEYRRVAELGLRPTHGSVVDTNSPNVIAIQFNAFGGYFKIYRR
jgi:type II secretory pathway pseudopilin PulG